jgi:hypothetical protein
MRWREIGEARRNPNFEMLEHGRRRRRRTPLWR